MVASTKDTIKAFFETGDVPTQTQFEYFIDSYVDKLSAVGDIETQASAGNTGFVRIDSKSSASVVTTAELSSFLDIGAATLTTAQASAVAQDVITTGGYSTLSTAQASAALVGVYTTTADASAAAVVAISNAYATTAQATAGTTAVGIMSPVLVAKALEGNSNWTFDQQLTLGGTGTTIALGGSNISNVMILAVNLVCDLNDHLFRIGDAGGIESSGYTGHTWTVSAAGTGPTDGWGIKRDGGAAMSGFIELFKADNDTNTWVQQHHIGGGANTFSIGAGDKVITSALSQLQITRDGGSGTYSGTIYIWYK